MHSMTHCTNKEKQLTTKIAYLIPRDSSIDTVVLLRSARNSSTSLSIYALNSQSKANLDAFDETRPLSTGLAVDQIQRIELCVS